MSIYVAGFVMPQQATCNTASGSSREGKRAKSRSRSFGASKVLPLRNANIRAKDVRQASPKTTLCGGHNSSLPLASTTSSSPHCDRCLCHHSHPRHQPHLPPSRDHLREPLTRLNHCSQIVTTTVCVSATCNNSWTTRSHSLITPNSARNRRASNPINRLTYFEQPSSSRSIHSFNWLGRLFGPDRISGYNTQNQASSGLAQKSQWYAVPRNTRARIWIQHMLILFRRFSSSENR
jgi:hypothetical protein